VADPACARPTPGAQQVLTRLAQAGATVAVVTGRPAQFVADRLGGVPGLIVHGLYGAQTWRDAELRSLPAAPGLAGARGELALLAQRTGAWLEDKGLSLALHTRRAADPQALLAQLREPVELLARRWGLVLEPGSLVWELRTPGPDKGDVLRALLPGYDEVLFAGDDHGDLAAVRAVRSSGVVATCVCVAREDGSERLRLACDVVVASPAALVELLRGLAP
jgi:trehalose 6-phosphate phosphatase